MAALTVAVSYTKKDGACLWLLPQQFLLCSCLQLSSSSSGWEVLNLGHANSLACFLHHLDIGHYSENKTYEYLSDEWAGHSSCILCSPFFLPRWLTKIWQMSLALTISNMSASNGVAQPLVHCALLYTSIYYIY